MIDWRVALVVWGCFLVLAVLTRYVSLGSSSTGGGLAHCHLGGCIRTGSCFAAVPGDRRLIVWKHRGNLQRLAAGTESKFHFHRS